MQQHEHHERALPVAPTIFPNEATCCVEVSEFEDHYKCLNFWGAFCPHQLFFEDCRLCDHPSAGEIFKRCQLPPTGEAGQKPKT